MMMKSLCAVAVLALAVFASAEHELGDGVQLLTMGNVSLASKGDWMLVLYAPWCGHCKNLLQLLPEIASNLKDSGVSVGAIDADKYVGVGMQFNIPGFPSIFRTHDGAVYQQPYNLTRSVEVLTEWVKEGWKKRPQVSGLKYPFGIPMMAWGAYTQLAIAASHKLEEFCVRMRIPPKLFVIAVLGTVAALMVTLIVLQILLGNKDKNQQKQQKQQQKQQKKEQKKEQKKGQAKKEEVPAAAAAAAAAEEPKPKKQSARQKRKQAGDAQIAAQVIQREGLNNPINNVNADSERVEEAVKKFKEEQKRNQRAARLEEEAERRKQAQKAEKHGQGKKKQRSQQNRPTQQPMKRS